MRLKTLKQDYIVSDKQNKTHKKYCSVLFYIIVKAMNVAVRFSPSLTQIPPKMKISDFIVHSKMF